MSEDLTPRELERRIDDHKVRIERRVDKEVSDIRQLINEVHNNADRRILVMEQSAKTLSENMKEINNSIKWLAMAVASSIVAAIMRFLLSGGFNA